MSILSPYFTWVFVQRSLPLRFFVFILALIAIGCEQSSRVSEGVPSKVVDERTSIPAPDRPRLIVPEEAGGPTKLRSREGGRDVNEYDFLQWLANIAEDQGLPWSKESVRGAIRSSLSEQELFVFDNQISFIEDDSGRYIGFYYTSSSLPASRSETAKLALAKKNGSEDQIAIYQIRDAILDMERDGGGVRLRPVLYLNWGDPATWYEPLPGQVESLVFIGDWNISPSLEEIMLDSDGSLDSESAS